VAVRRSNIKQSNEKAALKSGFLFSKI